MSGANAQQGELLHVFQGGGAAGRGLGQAVASVGDVDGDGHDDLIVGFRIGTAGGTCQVFSGRTGAVLFTFVGEVNGDLFGRAVGGAGDVDGDGVPDLIVGAAGVDVNGTDSGAAYVLSGRDGSLIHEFLGDFARMRLGGAVSGVGDLDGDGFADVIVGGQPDSKVSADVGLVRVHSGADGRVLHAIFGDATLDFFGAAAAGIGDFDADGVPDFAVGAYGDDDGGAGSGSVRVYSGATGSVLLRIDGDSVADELGYSVCGAGNAAGRGSADLAIGAPNDNQGAGSASGAVFVFAGAVPTSEPDPEPEPDPVPSVVRYCEPGANAFGPGARIDCGCEGPVNFEGFTLYVDGARPRSAGFFFFGAGRLSQPFMKGTLCIAPVRYRLGAAVHLDRKGSAQLTLAKVRPRWVLDLLTPGSTWNFQFAYLDPPACGSGPINLSDALSVTFAP